jgi:hypothetical protein
MRAILCAAVAVVFLGAARADEKNVEMIIEDWVKAEESLVNVLKSIKDKPSAEAALPKLTALDRLLPQSREAVKRSEPGADSEEGKALAEKFGKRVEQAKKQREVEYQRLNGQLDAYRVVQDNPLIKELQEDAEDRAKSGANTLNNASEAFRLKYSYYPSKLEELVKPPNGAPFVLKEALTDPFGRSYQYDPAGPKNNGLKTDVWSLGPRHVKDKIIGNWYEKK